MQGVELPAEGLVHADALADDYYCYDRARRTRSPAAARAIAIAWGDLLRVVVARVDLERRELDFRLAETKKRPVRPAKSSKDDQPAAHRKGPARPKKVEGRRKKGKKSLVP